MDSGGGSGMEGRKSTIGAAWDRPSTAGARCRLGAIEAERTVRSNGSRGAADEPARERRLRRAAIALGALPVAGAVAAQAWVFGDLAGFPLDDPWIHLTFARRLADGAGLSYPGTGLVAGSTAPLWTALLALAAALPLSLAALASLAQVAGVALHVAGVGLAWRLARRLDLAPARAALAAVLVGWSEGLVFAAGSPSSSS
jgi:hypothetical protein